MPKGRFIKIQGIERFVTKEQEALADALVKATHKFPLDANTKTLIEDNDFWLSVDKIVELWVAQDQEGARQFFESTKKIIDSQWDKRYAATKNKSLAWRGRFPLRLVQYFRKLFPNLSLTKEFGRRFVARYKAFKVAEGKV